MNKRILLIIASIPVIACALVAGFFTLGGLDYFAKQKKPEYSRTRIIIPGETDPGAASRNPSEQLAYAEQNSSKAPLGEGEEIISVLNLDFNGDAVEEQIIAYRSLHEIEGPVYAALNEFDARTKTYRRTWNAPTAITRPATVTLYSRDLIGDRSSCVVLGGMNNQGEHTLTIFKWQERNSRRPGQSASASATVPAFVKIAELRIDGAIRIQETERSQAYQLGHAPGQSFTILANGHDPESANLLDQIEIIYAYDPNSGLYERSRLTRIHGSQIEQRRLRELLSGAPGVFEKFINDLWYYVSPEGTIDNKQYIYFDPANREVIFYGDENLQVFAWRNSFHTRYGLYISSYNISVTTLSRTVNIELESLDSIRVKVFEEVRLKIGVNESWDGSYRRAGSERKLAVNEEHAVLPYIDAVYDSSLGRLRFLPGGGYVLSSGNATQTGRYVFFQVDEQHLLELRPDAAAAAREIKFEDKRMVYRVDKSVKTADSRDILSLSRIRLGSSGIQDLHEGIITLTPAGG